MPATRITRILPFGGAQGERACRERARASAKAAAAAQRPQEVVGEEPVVLPLVDLLVARSSHVMRCMKSGTPNTRCTYGVYLRDNERKKKKTQKSGNELSSDRKRNRYTQ